MVTVMFSMVNVGGVDEMHGRVGEMERSQEQVESNWQIHPQHRKSLGFSYEDSWKEDLRPLLLKIACVLSGQGLALSQPWLPFSLPAQLKSLCGTIC